MSPGCGGGTRSNRNGPHEGRKRGGKTLSGCRTAPLKPKLGLNGPPVLRWPCCPGSSPEIITHDQAENEPTSSHRALQRAADLRFSDTRVVTHRDFNHAVSGQGAFQDHLNRPAIGGFFERECA